MQLSSVINCYYGVGAVDVAEHGGRCLSFGADLYITKPFETVKLRNQVMQLLSDTGINQ